MSRKIHGENDSERITSEGTAARTRPLSIKDIMLWREKKAASESKKAKEGLENGKGKSTHLEQGREHKSRKDPRDMPVEGSRKEKSRDATREGSKKENPRHIPRENPKKEDMRYAPKEVSKKDNSRDRPNTGAKMDNLKDAPKVLLKEGLGDAPKKASKKQRPSGDDNHSVRKDIHHSQKLVTNMSGRADESKDRNLSEIRERKGDVMRSEYQKEPGKRWNDEAVGDDKIKFKSEKLRNETKRKDRSFDNERRSEVDRPMLKKQDSARFQDSKHSDRNAGRNEYAKPYHEEEPGFKRRRSRSRDHDRERYGRSISPPLREERYNYHGRDFGNYPPTTLWRNQGGSMLKLINKDRLGVEDTLVGRTRNMKAVLVDTHQGKRKHHCKLSRQLPRLLPRSFSPQKRNQPHGISLLLKQTNLTSLPLSCQLLARWLLLHSVSAR